MPHSNPQQDEKYAHAIRDQAHRRLSQQNRPLASLRCAAAARCLLAEKKQTLRSDRVMSAFDPNADAIVFMRPALLLAEKWRG